MQGIWQQVKSLIKEEISPSGFHLWIEPLGVLPEAEDALILTCPNPFALRWVKSHYFDYIRQALSQVCGQGLPVKLSALPGTPKPQNQAQ
ncbi:MAG: DnaA N-terminal domain-containing protein, partial [Syntrophales bacterium]|nr:DnaA N-terminal domain-containing protein [Syntrophales bacterium]